MTDEPASLDAEGETSNTFRVPSPEQPVEIQLKDRRSLIVAGTLGLTLALVLVVGSQQLALVLVGSLGLVATGGTALVSRIRRPVCTLMLTTEALVIPSFFSDRSIRWGDISTFGVRWIPVDGHRVRVYRKDGGALLLPSPKDIVGNDLMAHLEVARRSLLLKHVEGGSDTRPNMPVVRLD